MAIVNSIRKYIAPEFRCEFESNLSAERVWERLHEITVDSFPWPWKRLSPFHGIVHADGFRIALRRLDPGVNLNGKVEAKSGGSRILVTGGLSLRRFLFFVFCMVVLAWILWQAVPDGNNRFIALWAFGTPSIAALLHWLDVRSFREQLEESLECLRAEVGATTVSRICE